jgi:Holliday junction resolvase RusA-like endonuclease
VSDVHGFTLRVAGEAKGKQRARHGLGRTFTPRDTILAEQTIRSVGRENGEPRLPDGPVALEVELGVTRPAGHYTTRGTLNTAGLRMIRPFRRKPDVDNALKLVMDALNTCAWTDDVRVIDAHVYRVWSEQPYTLINARSLT